TRPTASWLRGAGKITRLHRRPVEVFRLDDNTIEIFRADTARNDDVREPGGAFWEPKRTSAVPALLALRHQNIRHHSFRRGKRWWFQYRIADRDGAGPGH